MKNNQFNFVVSDELKDLIKSASEKLGIPMASFVKMNLKKEAIKILENDRNN